MRASGGEAGDLSLKRPSDGNLCGAFEQKEASVVGVEQESPAQREDLEPEVCRAL